MRIGILMGHRCVGDHGPIDFTNVYGGRALTGSELAALNLARGLAERGHTVHLWCSAAVHNVPSCPELAGASVWCASWAVAQDFDAYISISEPSLLANVKSPALLVNLHQIVDFPDNYDPETVNAHVFLSPVHLQKMAPWHGEAATWIPNSMNPEDFAPAPFRPHSMAWLSSPDRGLHRLLELWPRIRAQVPDAELRIYYRIDDWLNAWADSSGPMGPRANYIRSCLNVLGRNGENGVTVIGPVSHTQLTRELCETQVVPYTFDPLVFTETFCVALLEACAAGCATICSDLDVLGDIFGSVAQVIPGRPGDNKDAWVEAIVHALLELPDRQRSGAFAQMFSRQRVAALWENFLRANRFSKELDASMIPASIAEFAGMPVLAAVPPAPVKRVRHADDRPLVSVLVPAYRPGGLDITFAALRDQTFKDFEVIIVDQRYEKRHDEVMTAAAQYGLDVIHAPEHRRNGEWIVAATAYNTAAALAAGEYIIFLHEWWWAPPDWIASHLALLRTDPKAISVTPYTTGEPPELATKRPFDFAAPREMVWEDPKGSVVAPDEVLGGDVLPEVFAFKDGPFDPAWIPGLAPISSVTYRPADNWHTDARRSMHAQGYKPNHTWSVMCNDGMARELFMELGGLDELCDKSKGIFDGEFSSRVYKVGGQVLYAPNCLCVSVRPQRVVRTRPCGGRGDRIGNRWSDPDGIAYYDKQRLSPRTIAQNPIGIREVARRLRFWRAPDAVRVPLDVPDIVYWGRDPLWPEDLPDSFFRDPRFGDIW